MNTDSTGAQFIRGLVKFVFIGCYAAFMWASIHHVATFFNNFEQGSDTVGSFMLAGAFDITALVTTIGVMFFRRSMPTGIQVIVWFFIIAIAAYSFFINWEYAAHFQNSALVLQSTGETTPVYDTHGVLHYVPVMRQNTALLVINPLLASGFTVFSLIYSIVAEFFGTKAPTIEEIRAKKTYLEEIAPELEEISKLENKNKKPGFIQRTKAAALELKEAAIEVVKKEQPEVKNAAPQTVVLPPVAKEENAAVSEEPNTDELHEPTTDEMQRIYAGITASINEENAAEDEEDEEENEGIITHETTPASRRSLSAASVTISEAAVHLQISEARVRDLKAKGKLRSPSRNKKLVLMSSIKAYDAQRKKQPQKEEDTPVELADKKAHVFSTTNDVYTREFVATA